MSIPDMAVDHHVHILQSNGGGTGGKLGRAVITVAGFAALSACILTIVSVWLQVKNYRKPLLQRYVVRILVLYGFLLLMTGTLLMHDRVPIFSTASWASLVSLKAAFWIDPFRDVYEAFTLYAFFQLLVNFIGGERALIVLMHGRKPVSHVWPLNYCLAKVDISDPHTFLAVKRGILQYIWVKPMLAIATIVMKATGTYQEGYIGLSSGYFWSGLLYNISISISLYSLAMFWVCMSDDLTPFRPMPKFLCIKGIIFASYWQGFFLSILVWLRAIPDDVSGYTPDNLASAIQDALICFEMPIFAVAHWYAFSWHDYADVTISAARMPVKFALRDAFGPIDLIQDAKETLRGDQYEYRLFDAGENIIAHEESGQRVARMLEGMRYERGGKGKYWVPKPIKPDSKTPLLGALRPSSSGRSADPSPNRYGASDDDMDPQLDKEDEDFYKDARALEFGDWHYPVITAHHASREDRLYRQPRLITNATNRHLLQSTRADNPRRKRKVREIQDGMEQPGKSQGSASASGSRSKSRSKSRGAISRLLLQRSTTSSSHTSSKSDSSQLVDLVVEDDEAEEIARVRARKEGSPEWNRRTPKHFVRAAQGPEGGPDEEMRTGAEEVPEGNKKPPQQHTVEPDLIEGEDDVHAQEQEEALEARQWQTRTFDGDGNGKTKMHDGGDDEEGEEDEGDDPVAKFAGYEEENVWRSPKR